MLHIFTDPCFSWNNPIHLIIFKVLCIKPQIRLRVLGNCIWENAQPDSATPKHVCFENTGHGSVHNFLYPVFGTIQRSMELTPQEEQLINHLNSAGLMFQFCLPYIHRVAVVWFMSTANDMLTNLSGYVKSVSPYKTWPLSKTFVLLVFALATYTLHQC